VARTALKLATFALFYGYVGLMSAAMLFLLFTELAGVIVIFSYTRRTLAARPG